MRIYKGVLFDYDGVIVPPTDNLTAWIRVFEENGVKMNSSDWYALEGYGPVQIAEALLNKYNIDNDPNKVAERKQEIYSALIKGKIVETYDEVEAILTYLKDKIALALVTGAVRKRLDVSIPQLMPLFNAVVAADDTYNGKLIKGKPAPDPFLVGATKLQVLPEQCIVVENAPFGLQSAHNAGCYPISLMTTVRDRKLLKQAGAREIFQTHKDLLAFFKRLFRQ